jgi:hypothetical protein
MSLDTSGALALLMELAPISRLDGAACRDQWSVFDAAHGKSDEARKAQADSAAVCKTCPVLGDCRRWADSLDRRDRSGLGVLAGGLPIQPGTPPKPQPEPKPQTAIAGPLRCP